MHFITVVSWYSTKIFRILQQLTFLEHLPIKTSHSLKLPKYPLGSNNNVPYTLPHPTGSHHCNNLENFHSFWHFFIIEDFPVLDCGGGKFRLRGKTNGGCLKGCSNIGSNDWKITKIWLLEKREKKSGYRGTTLRILATNVHHKLASNRQQSGKWRSVSLFYISL